MRANAHRVMPWKNGGGETTEIAASPAGATMDDFDWRVSMATVAQGGPFSLFPGVDRTLSVLEGEGITLTIAERAPITLVAGSPPFSFPADVATDATLVAGTITDLNVMTRRGTAGHTVRRIEVQDTAAENLIDSPVCLLLCNAGQLTFTMEGPGTAELGMGELGMGELGTRDCLLLDGWRGKAFTLRGAGTCFVIGIHPLCSHSKQQR